MRFIVAILLINLVASGSAQAGIQDQPGSNKTSYSATHHEAGIRFDVFFNEESEENVEANHKAIFIAELVDFSIVTTVLTKQHTGTHCLLSTLRISSDPLFKLNCTYLI